ncbi:MAG: hypothetical protein QOK59_03705, partial [Nitrososphaeraceae archaeon]|nr:hypothetical protein [Nitrososphaeraceae archaeon]
MRKTEYIGRDNDVKTIYGRTMTHKYFGKDFRIILVLALVAVVLVAPSLSPLRMVQGQQGQQPNQVTITAIVAEPKERWD